MEELVEVASIDGLWDEKAEAVSHDIANVKLDWRVPWLLHRHTFINGSLRFERDNYLICLEAPKTELRPAWGGGYGGIRYCINCKLIDCIHLWESTVTYKVVQSKFHYYSYSVSTCGICKRRIQRGASTCNQPSDEAWKLILKVANELGVPAPGIGSGYGSGWMCEFPVQVSQILDSDSEERAVNFIRNTFAHGLQI